MGFLFLGCFIGWLVFGGGWWLFFVILFGLAWIGELQKKKKSSESEVPLPHSDPAPRQPDPSGDPVGVPDRSLITDAPDGWQSQVREICGRYKGSRYFFGEGIPIDRLANAQSSFPLLVTDEHVALIYCATSTVERTQAGMLIGSQGISWRNLHERAARRSWSDLSASDIKSDGSGNITLGGNLRFYLGGGDFFREDAVRLLRELSEAYKHRQGGAQPTITSDIPLIDISRADYKALLTLPGIGPAEVGLILKRRLETGGPYSLEELAVLLQMKPHIQERLRGKATFSKRQPGVSARPEPKIDLPRPPNDGRIID